MDTNEFEVIKVNKVLFCCLSSVSSSHYSPKKITRKLRPISGLIVDDIKTLQLQKRALNISNGAN